MIDALVLKAGYKHAETAQYSLLIVNVLNICQQIKWKLLPKRTFKELALHFIKVITGMVSNRVLRVDLIMETFSLKIPRLKNSCLK